MSNFEHVKQLNPVLIFKIIKKNDVFIHTMFEGELLYRLGFSTLDLVDKTLHDLFPEDYANLRQDYYANLRQDYYEQAWEGNFVQYETRFSGNFFVESLRPITRDNTVVEVIGSCINITDLKLHTNLDEIHDNTLHLTTLNNPPLNKKNLMINDYYKTIFVPLNDIILIERLNRKSIIHTKEKQFETYESLTNLLEQLNYNFYRCHKSYIINTDYLEIIEQSGQKYYGHFKNYKIPAKISKNLVLDLKKHMSS